jgi:hypothetical protein
MEMAKLLQAVVLKHQGNLGEGAEEVAFEAGEPVTILKEWTDRYLFKKANGQMFTAPKELIEA